MKVVRLMMDRASVAAGGIPLLCPLPKGSGDDEKPARRYATRATPSGDPQRQHLDQVGVDEAGLDHGESGRRGVAFGLPVEARAISSIDQGA